MILRNGVAALKSAGADGKALLHDVDVYVDGLNARRLADKSSPVPYTRVDVFAFNALAGQIFGQGGGDEARRSELLSSMRSKLGKTKANQAFNDVTEFNDPSSPTTISKKFSYGKTPKNAKGGVALDAGSFKPAGPSKLARTAGVPRWASNFLILGANRSNPAHSLFVTGPHSRYLHIGLSI